MWGAVFSTAPVMNAGSNCVWGSSWAPSEGHVVVPLRATRGSLVALRVLDYDFGQKDDVLGECLLDVDALLAAPGQLVSVPLWRRQGLTRSYAPQLVHGQPSMLQLCALPEPADAAALRGEWAQGARRVRFCLVSASNLRSGDVLSSNDVYCKLWEPFGEAHQGSPLPEPPAKVVMPQANQLSFPFTFQLPANMPSTLEGVPDLDYGFMRCSVYAHIDIAWRRNPSVRAFVNIVQPVTASLPRLLMPVCAADTKPMFGVHCGCCCECCLECFGAGCCENKSDPLGDVVLEVALARAGMAPGELVPFTQLRAVNCTERPSAFFGTASACASLRERSMPAGVLRVEFVRSFVATAYMLPGSLESQTALTVFEAPVPAGATVQLTPEVLVPLLSPDYHGWGDAMTPYPKQFSSWGARWGRRDEPLRWATCLRVTLDTPGTPFDLQHDLPIFIAALPPTQPQMQPQRALSAAPHGQRMESSSSEDLFFARVSANELVGAAAMTATPPRMAAQEGVFAKNPEEDCKCDNETLTLAPTYFVVVSPTPRYVASPYTGVVVDVSSYPPGAVVTCPQTGQPFVVPYWGEPIASTGE